MALYGDALWASGLFEEAEQQVPGRAGGGARAGARPSRHGAALAARSQLDEAMNEAQAALRLSPRDLEIHHTVGTIYERHAQVRGGGRRLLATTSTCCRTRITARRPTGRAPRSGSCARSASACRSRSDPGADDRLYTVDFRLVNDKVVVRAKVNDALGAGLRRRHRRRRTPSSRGRRRSGSGITPVTYTLSAGVGDVGLRGLQLARIDSLELGLAEAAQRAVPHQEPAAARHAGARRPRACRRSRSASR